MAIVNIDLSQYDSLRNRKKELEEQVKELKEQVKDLKSGSKVIIRTVKEVLEYSDYFGSNKNVTNIVSESYVGFDDVRLKVEESMKEEIASSIKIRIENAEAYRKKREELEKTMFKEYKERVEELIAKNHSDNDSWESRFKHYDSAFNQIKGIAERVLLDLDNRFFKPKAAIEMVNDIRTVCTTKIDER